MSKTNKHQLVKNYLLEHGHISSWEAIEMFGATRLASIIFNLRKTYDIETKMVVHKDRYGNVGEFADYVFLGKLEK